jgi:glycosyltransferase involved in cell wall biosynthesis
MRFAFISAMEGLPWHGSEGLWSRTATGLKRAGHDVWASVEHWQQRSDKVTALRQQGVKIETHFSFQVGRARQVWNELSLHGRRSYGRLRHFKPDLVVIFQGTNAGGSEWAKACREAAIPYVMIVHCNSEFWWFREHFSEAVASYTAARRIFCVSRNNLDLLRLQVGEPLPNGEVIWNPCDLSPESPPAWPDESRVWRLACVARTDIAAKGQDLLLQTLARPEWRDRPIELNFFGDGPHQLALRRIADMLQLDNVHFRGHVSNIRAIWEQNHLLVLPSRYEGMPPTLVEAMWCGRPAVVTDVGGNAELCVDGETGFVAPAATVPCFADALQRAWDRRKEWPQMGQAARARVESQIPKDPVALFCERLKVCVSRESGDGSAN